LHDKSAVKTRHKQIIGSDLFIAFSKNQQKKRNILKETEKKAIFLHASRAHACEKAIFM